MNNNTYVHQIQKRAADLTAEQIVLLLKNFDPDKYIETIKVNFNMMYELGTIGCVLEDVSLQKNDTYLYSGTLPYTFAINDDNGNLYTHHTAAVKAKEIIRKYIKNQGLEEDIKDFSFCYRMRDEVWDKERQEHYLAIIKEEIDALDKSLEEIMKQGDDSNEKD